MEDSWVSNTGAFEVKFWCNEMWMQWWDKTGTKNVSNCKFVK